MVVLFTQTKKLMVDPRRVFPYLVLLNPRDNTDRTVWFPSTQGHIDCVNWLRENMDKANKRWYCNDAGVYYFREEEDAMAFKLRWL